MVVFKLSDCFKHNFLHLTILGIWPGENSPSFYKYYSFIFLCINLLIYNSLLILNLVFTPRKIELMVPEVIFLFTEVTVMAKVFMVLLMRNKFVTVFNVLNCEAFKGANQNSEELIKRHVLNYKTYWKRYTVLGNFSFFSRVFAPIIKHYLFNSDIELPICTYYFLDEGVVQRYFAFWFIYQSVGMYSHMQYNVDIDTLIAGLLYLAIAQVKVLNNELKNLKFTKMKHRCPLKEDELQVIALHKNLKNYEVLLNYCSIVQDILGATLFVQFGMAAIIMCVVLSAFLLPLTIELLSFLVTYLGAIILEIFVPSWLGTQLIYESGDLVTAAYCCEWIPRSERFKRSLKLFMARANSNIVITGWQIFPLTLNTFTSIVKTAYSFFTLIRNFQDLTSQLESLSRTLCCWRLLGLWPGKNPSRFYRCYTIVFLFSTMVIYDTALAINLFCTPLKIELLIQEVTFLFNVISITTKILMVIVWRKRILKLLKILDDEMFQGKDDATQNILAEGTNSYILYRNILMVVGHFAYSFNSVIPIIANQLIPSYVIKFPTSNYYFFKEETKKDYFAIIFGYQAFGIYGLMMSDISVDTFINGCLFFGISQIKVLNYKLRNLKCDESLTLSRNLKEHVQIMKLNECLRHYDRILKYCSEFQIIINFTLFIQYAMGAMIICVLLCGLLLPLTSEEYTFMVTYLSAMVLQIFVPGWLGTQISYESQELVFAAYNSDWIPRTERFKRSIKIFVERANTPIVMVGLKMFPLSLETFVSIMKTAYSFMTLVRNVQDREE
ncbi:uncharacterized protein LOC120630353 [Pararge aegeria]|uniref:uncharacterized protein LOC120630353 n=1 Tax=Pararge aegeria TaxID=116150 RepID=UPI0019D09BF5|nr:uncharacterized protein LOC120630353 [Pararge aegeria]